MPSYLKCFNGNLTPIDALCKDVGTAGILALQMDFHNNEYKNCNSKERC